MASLVLFVFSLIFVSYIYGFRKASVEISSQYQIQLDDFLSQVNVGNIEPTLEPLANESSKKVVQEIRPAVNWGGPELWEVVNKSRVEHGVNPLNQNDELCTIASIRLNELLKLGELDGHEGFSTMPDRRPDLKWIFEKYVISEFLALGGATPDETVVLWLNTLAHKKLLTGGEYSFGCIYAQNTFAVAITAY